MPLNGNIRKFRYDLFLNDKQIFESLGDNLIDITKTKKDTLEIREKVVPKVLKKLSETEQKFQAEYDDEKDLKELLNLSNQNLNISNLKS